MYKVARTQTRIGYDRCTSFAGNTRQLTGHTLWEHIDSVVKHGVGAKALLVNVKLTAELRGERHDNDAGSK